MRTIPALSACHNPQGQPALPENLRQACAVAASIARDVAGNTGYSDDVLSATVVALLESAQRYDPDRGAKLSTYAYRRMRGEALRSAQKEWRARAVRASGSSENVTASAGEQVCTRVEATMFLQRTLPELDQQHRTVLQQHYFEGRSIAAIARSQRWTHNLATRRHASLLRRLRAHADR